MRVPGLLLGALAGILAGALGTRCGRSTGPTPAEPIRATIDVPAGHRVDAVALSPDGRRLVYAAAGADGRRLYVRPLDSVESRAIDGTDGAREPFFAPDGGQVAFFADGRLRRVPLAGGIPTDVCEAPSDSAGGSWGPDDTIVFAPLAGRGLMTVSAGGGQPEVLTRPRARDGEVEHGWPHVLPDGAGYLFTVARRDRDPRLAVLPSGTSEWRLLTPAVGAARFLHSGHVLYTFANELLAVPVNGETLALEGGPIDVAAGVFGSFRGAAGLGRAGFDVAPGGEMLVHLTAVEEDGTTEIVRVGRDGGASRLAGFLDRHQTPRVAPDGKRLAVAVRSGPFTRELWIYEIEGASRTRFTTEGGDNHSPAWRGDGREIAFASNRDGNQTIYVKNLQGGAARHLIGGAAPRNPGAWSRDGRTLAFYEITPDTARDIWTLGRDGAVPRVAGPANERSPALSPDGRWLAYVSDESGNDEVYVAKADGTEGRRVSRDGGTEPVWSRDGQELFYRALDRMVAVPVASGGEDVFGAPLTLFARDYERDPGANVPNYDVMPDGETFVMLRRTDPPPAVRLILNWSTDFARRAGPGRRRR